MRPSRNEGPTSARVSHPLPRLRPGRQAVVCAVGPDDGAASDVARLQAMGVCRGRTVLLVRAGDPLIVRVLGSRVGLSARLAERVEVTAEPSDFATVVGRPR